MAGHFVRLPAMKVLTLAAVLAALPAHAHDPLPAGPGQMQHGHAGHAMTEAVPDTRTEIEFPAQLKLNTLAHMRDHLLAIQEITALLADKQFDAAADTAENRLGLSSMRGHGAHQVGQYMPQPMREIGQSLHRRASEFAIKIRDAGATGDTGPALKALARMQESCVACHTAYRLK
jgi:hypothetical protein